MPQDTVIFYGNPDSILSSDGHYIRSPQEIAQLKARAIAFQQKEQYYDVLGNNIIVVETLIIGIVLFLLARKAIKDKKDPARAYENSLPYASYDEKGRRVYSPPPLLVYKGKDLDLPDDIVNGILIKRFPFYRALGPGEQRRFLFRHKKFMRNKVFKIHDAKGFREMPVLISAAAIQLSFGLEEYLLPFYTYINIFPQEFIRTGQSVCFLEGNVSGNNIKISWKHFLEGYDMPENGENVGLHEMAHAYYCQNFVCGGNADPFFTKGFDEFTYCGEKAFEAEKNNSTDLYSDYALRNFQEFWAESVELFFERPGDMKKCYPDVYAAMCKLLNQSP